MLKLRFIKKKYPQRKFPKEYVEQQLILQKTSNNQLLALVRPNIYFHSAKYTARVTTTNVSTALEKHVLLPKINIFLKILLKCELKVLKLELQSPIPTNERN